MNISLLVALFLSAVVQSNGLTKQENKDNWLKRWTEWSPRSNMSKPYELTVDDGLKTGAECKAFRCEKGYSSSSNADKSNVMADCLDSYMVCDGLYECIDGTDETEEACNAFDKQYYYLLYNDEFYEDAYALNGEEELGFDAYAAEAASGEVHMTIDALHAIRHSTGPGLPPDCTYKCSNGYIRLVDHFFDCMRADFVCDGVIDCRDAQDESVEKCSKTTECPKNKFACRTRKLFHPEMLSLYLSQETVVCADDKFRCDGKKDCDDGADENECR